MKITTPKMQKAIDFATEKHKDDIRKGSDEEYINHPLEAIEIAAELTDDEDIICAAVLHDTIEDAHVTVEELTELFGERIASLVADESENKRPELPPEETWKIRKTEALEHLRHASRDAKIVALSDKLSNMRSIHRDYDKIGDKFLERFNCKIKTEQGWYYGSFVKIFEEFADTDAWQEYKAHVEAVFGTDVNPK